MQKPVTVLVEIEDEDNISTYTDFASDTTNEELFFVMSHLCMTMKDRGINLEDMLNALLDYVEPPQITTYSNNKYLH